jgi:hypothetical protein
MVMKTRKTIFIASIFSIVLILAVIISFESSLAQEKTEDDAKKNEASQSKKGDRVRNPFLLPSGVYLPSKQGVGSVPKEKVKVHEVRVEEPEPPSLKVKAILISDQIRLAAIASRIVAVGDKIDGETILEIKKDRVILGRGNSKRTLHLHQSPVQLAIEQER